MENHLIHYLETYTSYEIIAQTTTFTVLVVVLHHFFEIFPCFHYQTVLITDAKVIYYIGTAIRANGDLPSTPLSPSCEEGVLNPLPSPRPFQKGKGCNRPPVLRTATL